MYTWHVFRWVDTCQFHRNKTLCFKILSNWHMYFAVSIGVNTVKEVLMWNWSEFTLHTNRYTVGAKIVAWFFSVYLKCSCSSIPIDYKNEADVHIIGILEPCIEGFSNYRIQPPMLLYRLQPPLNHPYLFIFTYP